MVLIAVLALSLYAGEAISHVKREARISITEEKAEMAYWAAEAGFNRMRARLQTDGDKVGEMHDLTGDLTIVETGQVIGHYVVQVREQGAGSRTFEVISTGTWGPAACSTCPKRVVAGTIKMTLSNGTWKISTTYYR